MEKSSRQLAILLALVLALAAYSPVWADLPDPDNHNGGSTTDGHPWDDETVEDDPADPGSAPISIMPNRQLAPTVASSQVAPWARAISERLHSAWTRILRVLDFKANFHAGGWRRM